MFLKALKLISERSKMQEFKLIYDEKYIFSITFGGVHLLAVAGRCTLGGFGLSVPLLVYNRCMSREWPWMGTMGWALMRIGPSQASHFLSL